LHDFRRNRTELFRSLIEKRKNSSAYDKSNPQSYIDYMLTWLENKNITMDEMISDAFIMFSAGTETTSSSLEYSILLLCKYPIVQQQIYEELFSLWQQKNKNYSNNDNYLHYDNELFIGSTIYRAFIHEMYRISSIVSQGVDHANLGKELTVRVSEEDSFDNKEHEYTIPADTVIIYNSEYIHTYNKKENWVSNSTELCLENWYDNNKKNNTKTFSTKNRPLYAFGTGKRDCVGRQLAEKEVHIVLGYLILNYEFSFYNKEDSNNLSNIQFPMSYSAIRFVDPQIDVLVNKRKN